MKTNKKQGVAAVHEHPGRPRYEMKFPRGAEWTFTQLMAVNGVETDKGSKKFGKGDNCTMLTLRKNLKHDMFRLDGKVNSRSLVLEVKGVTAEPDSALGLGRRATLFRLRAIPTVKAKVVKAKVVKATVIKAKVVKAKSKAKTSPTAKYEATKAALFALPETTIVTAPVAPAPVAETPAPAPEVEIPIANEAPAAPEAAPVQAPAETIAA